MNRSFVLPVLLAGALAGPTAGAFILPPEGLSLHATHVQFEWDAVSGADAYDLEVVADDGSPDPFGASPLVVDVTRDASEPRAVVTSGLVFGTAYAWRARGRIGAVPLAWGPIHRFETAALPAYVPTPTVTIGAAPRDPGLTLFNVQSLDGSVPTGLAIAVDDAGTPVWFFEHAGGILDVRLRDSGRILAVGAIFSGFDRAIEVTRNGQLAWISPDDPDLRVHHEAFPMPNGNVLAPVYTYDLVYQPGVGVVKWRGDRYVEFDRATNQIVWDWNTFDHLSTLDFDPDPGTFDLGDNAFNWTHTNSAIYNEADDSVYVSLRHLSRVTRIDYATGQIVHQVGFAMPSGAAAFGDNLFSFQHAPEILANGNLLLFDNGNRRDHQVHGPATGVTKAVELAFSGNPPTGASIAWEWTLPSFEPFVGDADRLPDGNTLVTAGVSAKLYEVDASGTEAWRLELPSGSPTYLIFRAQRIPALIVDAPADADADGLADDVDNCPDHANPAQGDCDGDGFGDVCTVALGLARCSDGIDDDGDGFVDLADPGCDCAGDPSERTPTLVCDDDVDADGDGAAAAPQDAGCAGPTDPTETSMDLVCDNGVDDDADGATDFPADAGCWDSRWPLEDPQCEDGVDNDGDGLVDWAGLDLNGDGDFLDPGESPPDDGCKDAAFRNRELGPPQASCGLGSELALVLAGLSWARRARRRA